MKYTYQTIFGVGGNCFQACLAAIMECPLDKVPHFMEGMTEARPWTQEEWDEVWKWHNDHGWRIYWLDPDDEEDWHYWIPRLKESCLHYIANVKSVYGGHSVVGHRGELVFCPNGGDPSTYGEPYCYYVLERLPAECPSTPTSAKGEA